MTSPKEQHLFLFMSGNRHCFLHFTFVRLTQTLHAVLYSDKAQLSLVPLKEGLGF